MVPGGSCRMLQPTWRCRQSETDEALVPASILINGSNVQGIPAIDPAQGDLAAGEQRPEQHAGGLGARQQALRLDPPLELLVQPFNGIRGSDRFPLFRRIAREREQSWSGLFQTISRGRALQPPFPEECLAPGFHVL